MKRKMFEHLERRVDESVSLYEPKTKVMREHEDVRKKCLRKSDIFNVLSFWAMYHESLTSCLSCFIRMAKHTFEADENWENDSRNLWENDDSGDHQILV